MNCELKDLYEFDRMKLPGKKFVFTKIPRRDISCGIYYPGFEKQDQIYNDTFYWNRYFDVEEFINK